MSTVYDHPAFPLLDWPERAQLIAFDYFLSQAGAARPILVEDPGLYHWALGDTPYVNVTAWRFPA